MSLLRNIIAAILIIIGMLLVIPTVLVWALSAFIMTDELHDYIQEGYEESKEEREEN